MIGKESTGRSSVSDYDVCLCRLKSQITDVNMESDVGMCTCYDVLQ